MGSIAEEKNKNHFEGGKVFDWDNYVFCRPDYNIGDFYDSLYAFHGKHGTNSYSLAYDVGCGPGQVASTLSRKFEQVVASDLSPAVVDVARKRLSSASNIDFIAAGGETVLRDGDEGKVDLITVAETQPFLNHEAAFEHFSKLLKPNGTLAIWFHGGPIYQRNGVEDELCKEVRALHREITLQCFDVNVPMHRNWRGPWTMISSWLDALHVPSEKFDNIKRIKHNPSYPLMFIDDSKANFPIEFENRSEKDDVSSVEKSTLWQREKADAAFVKGFIEANIPMGADKTSDQIEALYKELDEKMAGQNFQAVWPCVVILATKK